MFGLPQSLYTLTERDLGSPLVLPFIPFASVAAAASANASAQIAIPQDQVAVVQSMYLDASSTTSTERITVLRVGLVSSSGADLGGLWASRNDSNVGLIGDNQSAVSSRVTINRTLNWIFPAGCSIQFSASKDAAVGTLNLGCRMFGWLIPASRFGRL